jgi:prepilin-type N-terminal cleavage/methylation domain-containing protein
MRDLTKQKGFTLVELFIVLFILGMLFIGPACLHYTVNFWLGYQHKPQSFGWGWSLLGIPFFELSVPAAFITKILSFFL